jgi:hypothetical protein
MTPFFPEGAAARKGSERLLKAKKDAWRDNRELSSCRLAASFYL